MIAYNLNSKRIILHYPKPFCLPAPILLIIVIIITEDLCMCPVLGLGSSCHTTLAGNTPSIIVILIITTCLAACCLPPLLPVVLLTDSCQQLGIILRDVLSHLIKTAALGEALYNKADLRSGGVQRSVS